MAHLHLPLERRIAKTFKGTWDSPPGILEWFAVVNNQRLGVRFMITSLIFFALGGLMAILMRMQLTVADANFIDPEIFNQLFTMHGSTMMFLLAVPFIEGLALYLIPMMIGSRDVAFPRLTAFSYWTYLFGGLVFYVTFLLGTVPDVGWFAYTPLSTAAFRGISVDFWLLGLALVEIAGITAGIEIVVSILKLRAPGMSISRMPLFVWTMLVAGLMVIIAFTVLLTATTMLELDRAFSTRFFSPDFGGSTLLWAHLFWFFGHPEVYIMFLPATGIVSAVVVAFSRRPLAGYVLIAVAVVITGFVSFGLWVHHMFTTGLPELSMSFFTAASLMISVASGTQIFAWIATVWGTKPIMRVPFLYILGFILIFVPGGITGVMVAVVPFNWQVHDTYFIVAHLHYVIIGGVVFPIIAGFYYWIPKLTGRMLSESLGKWSFWLSFLGFNITFFPMHLSGLFGMPRRVYTYPETLGITGLNLISTIGSFILAIGFLLTLLAFLISLRKKPDAGANPWAADTLEWSIPSPPPVYSFLKPPVVHSRSPLKDQGKVATSKQTLRAVEALDGRPIGWRATLATDSVAGELQAIQPLAGPSLNPFFLACACLAAAVGVLAQAYLVSIVALMVITVLVFAWLKPDKHRLMMIAEDDTAANAELPVFAMGAKSVSWWGCVFGLTIAGTVFTTLVFAYYYIMLFSKTWPQGELGLPHLGFAVLMSLIMAFLIATELWLSNILKQPDATGFRVNIGLTATAYFAAIFLTSYAPIRQAFTLSDNAYASAFYILHWALAVMLFIAIMAKAILFYTLQKPNYFACITPLTAQISGMISWFSVATVIVVFAVIYASPFVF